jgi:hypothetical protein
MLRLLGDGPNDRGAIIDDAAHHLDELGSVTLRRRFTDVAEGVASPLDPEPARTEVTP